MLPLLLLAVGTVALWPLRGWLTAEAIARWSPAQSAKAAVCLWALYGVKSLSVAVPLSALTAAGGLLFPYPAALFVNLFGTALAQTLPYLLGRRNREELTALQERYAALRALERALDCRSVFLLRLSGAPPGDVVSFYLSPGLRRGNLGQRAPSGGQHAAWKRPVSHRQSAILALFGAGSRNDGAVRGALEAPAPDALSAKRGRTTVVLPRVFQLRSRLSRRISSPKNGRMRYSPSMREAIWGE